MEIDQDYLRTGTAIGFRAFREQGLRFLVLRRGEESYVIFWGEVENDRGSVPLASL